MVFGLTIFLGAFLLFQVQPLIAKYILPWFGGGPGVWTACMLFFQIVLVAGYAYAHLTSRWLKPRAQIIVHMVLLLAALAWLPITPSNSWKPTTAENPAGHILALLVASLGLPYFVLSTTGPLLQQWFSRTHPGRSPYRLYALSNVGSLAALLSYPIFFENHFTRKTQASLWGTGLIAFVICCAFCAFKLWKRKSVDGGESTPTLQPSSTPPLHYSDTPSPLSTKLLWLLLPACASTLLLATTNEICQDVAVIPFLWVVPLALYLLSFVVCFDNPRWYRRGPFGTALVLALAAACWALSGGLEQTRVFVPLGIYCAALLICCMICHGELYRLRPDPRHLTSFYLFIAVGGALGGVFVAVIAPLVFTDYYELHLGLFACGLLFALCVGAFRDAWCVLRGACIGMLRHPFIGVLRGEYCGRGKDSATQHATRNTQRVLAAALPLGLIALALALWSASHRKSDGVVERSRNFYGVLTVREFDRGEARLHRFQLDHGPITHGLQFVDPLIALRPTGYFTERSGVGLAVRALPSGQRRIGVVGLGAGTLASYAQSGDYLRFYEINPDVQRLASTCFSYLSNCEGRVEFAIGDARLCLEREAAQNFDLLALDAFNSDAIPVHLLTSEAFEVYQRHVKSDGVIAVHISNKCLNLEPVVLALARHFNLQAAVIAYGTDNCRIFGSTWVLLSRQGAVLQAPSIQRAARSPQPNLDRLRLWSDDFTSLFEILGKVTAGELKRDFSAAQCNAAARMMARRDYAGAIKWYRRALESDPDLPEALNNLAWLLAVNPNASVRNGAEAVQLAEQACLITHFRHTSLIGTLAAAYAESGRFEEAVATAQRACTLASSRPREHGEQAVLRQNQQLLELYRTRKPYHEDD